MFRKSIGGEGFPSVGEGNSDPEPLQVYCKKWLRRKDRAKEGLEGLIVEGKEAFADFFRIVFSENVGSSNLPLGAQRVEGDEPPPGFVSSKKIQRGTPPTPIQIHAPGFHGDRRR